MPAGQGMFIGVEVDDAVARDADVAKQLTDACPVDIFRQHEDGSLALVEPNLDECVLCDLCIEAAPAGAVRILKLYE